MAPYGWTKRSATAPIMTPPASVAFWMCSITNLLCSFKKEDVAKAVITDAHREKNVFITALNEVVFKRQSEVDSLPMLGLSVSGSCAVEAGPEHPQEDGAHHGEQVRGVS